MAKAAFACYEAKGQDTAAMLPCDVLLPGGPCRCQGCPRPSVGCWLGGGRFPGEGRLLSLLGNVGVSGQGGLGPAHAAGGLLLLAGGF